MVLADDGGVSDVVPFWRHRRCRSHQPDREVPGETLDLLGIERWRCFCVVVPFQGIILEFAPVEGTSDVGGARLVEQLPMKIAPTMVMVDDGGVLDVVPLSRHRRCSLRHQARDALGETLDRMIG